MNRRKFLKCLGVAAAAPVAIALVNVSAKPDRVSEQPYSSAREALLAEREYLNYGVMTPLEAYRYAEFQSSVVNSIAKALVVPKHMLLDDINVTSHA